MRDARPIIVLGAGPAGATLARLLAEAGRRVLIVDARGPHEKVCGGGVTARGYRGRGLLDGSGDGCEVVTEAVLEAHGARVHVRLPTPVRVYPRKTLNGILFEAAVAAGVQFVPCRARGLRRHGEGFRLELAGAPPLDAAFVAGADGAAGISRKVLGGGRGRERFVLAAGFHARRARNDARLFIAFPPGLAGYAWVFPRPDHLSVGICSRHPRITAAALRGRLASLLLETGWELEPIPGGDYCFPIPDFTAFEGPRAGPGWALLGDAGAFVDPITLEGISYAIRSAELLAPALLAEDGMGFEAAWRADFGRELALAARLADRFYADDFTARMVRCAADHARVREVLGGLLAGQVQYRGLRRRVLAALAADVLGGIVRPWKAAVSQGKTR